MYEKLFDLTGKTALVTGGSKGLGLAMARAYAEHGANIMICSRNEDELKRAATDIGQGVQGRVEWMQVDMAVRAESDALAEETLKRFGRVDVLVNNAGSNSPQHAHPVNHHPCHRIVELNQTSIMRLTRALVPQMKERKWGRIIHISSVLGVGGKKDRTTYCSTKAALVGMVRAQALDLGPWNITVNCIAPGPFLTDLPGRLLNDEQKQYFADRTALGRWGQTAEIAGPALLLGTDAGSYITGTTLLLDGGALANIL